MLALDREHNLLSGITSTPYTWDIEEVALDSQGRPLALVWLKLTDPDDRIQTIKLQKRNRECQLVEDRTEEVTANFFPADDGIWALIDVEARSVLGVTAGQAFSPSFATSTSRLLRQMRLKQTFIGGPVDGIIQENCFDAPAMQENPSYTKVVTGVVTQPTEGFVSVTFPGRFRNDLQPLLPDPGIVTMQLEGDAVYFVDDFTQTNRAVRIKSTQADIGSGTLSPQTIDEARIMRPIGDSPKVLISFPQLRDSGFNYTTAKLVGWSPESPANTTLASSGQLPLSGSAYFVLSATSQTALVAFDDSNAMAFSTWLMDLANNNTLAFPGQLLNQAYVLLEPRFLYNINDTKFHTLDASLRPTALPRSLAQGSPVSGFDGAYHLIRLQ